MRAENGVLDAVATLERIASLHRSP
jgi:hypothetical protein